MARKTRNGKYEEYEKQIFENWYDYSLNDDFQIAPSWLLFHLDIPRSSFYDIIKQLEKKGLVRKVEKKERYFGKQVPKHEQRGTWKPGIIELTKKGWIYLNKIEADPK